MIKIILKSAGCAAIPFILLSSGWAWGFATRQMLGWHPMLLIAIFASILVFCVSLLLFTVEAADDIAASSRNLYFIAITVIVMAILIAPLSYLYEAAEAKKVAQQAQKEERQSQWRLNERNFRSCVEELKKGGRHPAEIPECQNGSFTMTW